MIRTEPNSKVGWINLDFLQCKPTMDHHYRELLNKKNEQTITQHNVPATSVRISFKCLFWEPF